MTGLMEHQAAEQTADTRRHRVSPLILTAGGVAAMIGSVQLGVGTLTAPGPGAWPLAASTGVVLTGLWLTVTGTERPEPVEMADAARVLVAIATMAMFVVLLPLVGMPLPALVALLGWLLLFGESWKVAVPTAVLGVVALQVVFVDLLAVPLPVGPLAPGGW